MEIRVDPMIVLQCSVLDDDEEEDENGYSSDNSEIDHKPAITNGIDEKLYYPCLACPKRFASELALQEHMWGHNQKPKRILLMNYDNLICEKGEEIQNDLIKTENGVSNLAENGNAIRFNCPICGKIISTKGNLKVHLETHRPKGKYACDICGRM
ncbi:zinc finger protein [Oryctes borbonicus]|uniref:Zinc finger protein n=1 Tax=Oryctes borbonicus TaxID=1629725 RepID=A0A0T6AVM0_9SCAR|nr:zinc finger protein [Oryctes borbonicus]